LFQRQKYTVKEFWLSLFEDLVAAFANKFNDKPAGDRVLLRETPTPAGLSLDE